jgi:asparagine synthase (glutamine-hydrolysing)
MSGFVAAVCDHEQPDLQASLGKMSDAIAHRGQLKTAAVFSSRCAAIPRYRDKTGVRVSTYSNDRHAIVLDGYIFNQQELARAVGTDRSAGIAQVVLEGFEKHDDHWFERLDGSFAVMIVDLQSHEILLVRDKFAHRPLYFGLTKGNRWVATEIKAVLAAPGFDFSINVDNLYSSIGYGMTPGPQTLFKGIYKCVPGFVFRLSPDGKYRANDYLAPTVSSRLDLSMGEAKEFILSTLREHVGRYLGICPDVGVLLSGGVDSALIAHLVADSGSKRTPAIGFGASDWSEDETADARQMADRLGLGFIRASTSPDDNLLGSFRNVVRQLEDPTRFENALPFEIGARSVSGNCSALMTGEGADYILGQREHAVVGRLDRILRMPGFLRSALGSMPLEKFPVGKVRSLAPYLKWKSMRDYGQRATGNCCDLLPGGDNDRPPENEIVEMLSGISSDWPIGAQYTFMVLREAGHCWIERMEKISAAAGLECFHPFENNALFQFGLELPDQFRNSNGVNKPAVRSLAADLFGKDVAYRKKRQLAAPMQMWLNQSEQLRNAVMGLKDADSRIRSYLDNTVVNRYLEQYEREGAQSESIAVHLFRMLAFEIWLESFD